MTKDKSLKDMIDWFYEKIIELGEGKDGSTTDC
jgi:hypothetical protein